MNHPDDQPLIDSLADVLPHRLRRKARETERYDDVTSRLLYEAAALIIELREELRMMEAGEDASRTD